MGELHLRVLEQEVRITSQDERWIHLLAIMFEPFVVEDTQDPSRFFVDVSNRVWTFGFSDDEQAQTDDPWYLLFRARVLIAEKALLTSPLVTLHAAMAAKGEGVLVFAGASGAGKSTLVTDLSEKGWSYGTDEFVAFDQEGTAIPLNLPAVLEGTSSWERWSSRWEVPDWLPAPRDGFAIPPSVLHPLLGPSRATEVAFITFDASSASARTTLTPARALAEAGGHSFVMDPARMGYLASVFRTTPASQITYPATGAALEAIGEVYGVKGNAEG